MASSKTSKKSEVYETSFNMDLVCIYKGVISLAIFAFLSCVLLSIIFDFEKATFTHCRVKNYLPSVSAAIGGFVPQKYIWQYMISLHCSPRILFSFLAHKYFMSFSSKTFKRSLLINTMVLVEIVEVLSLLTLTILSSSEAYAWHEKSFIIFIFCSQANMLLKIAIFFSLRQLPEFSIVMEQSLWRKVKLWVLNVCGIAFGGYFFLRHNNYCEAGIYTLFALSEYTVVISNILFHMTGFLEFSNTGATFHVSCFSNHKRKPS